VERLDCNAERTLEDTGTIGISCHSFFWFTKKKLINKTVVVNCKTREKTRRTLQKQFVQTFRTNADIFTSKFWHNLYLESSSVQIQWKQTTELQNNFLFEVKNNFLKKPIFLQKPCEKTYEKLNQYL